MTVLKKSEGMRAAFCGWDFAKVASFGDEELQALLANPDIIRHRAKCEAAIHNAKWDLGSAEHLDPPSAWPLLHGIHPDCMGRQAKRLEENYPGGFVAFVWQHGEPKREEERLIHGGKHLSSHMRSDYKTKAEVSPAWAGARDRQEEECGPSVPLVWDSPGAQRERWRASLGCRGALYQSAS